jgi:predicted  nucleic acid-binding Zn-ribbon protein
MARVPNPLGFVGAPGELVSALRHLPDIARHTHSMSEDTEALEDVRRHIADVAERTKGIQTMDARMANIEAAMPVLIDVQKDLALLPDIIARLDERMDSLSRQLDRLAASLEGLEASIKPLGRLAGRLPGSKNAADKPPSD